MEERLTQGDIDALTALIGTDWRVADRGGFYVKYYEILKRIDSNPNGPVMAAANLVLVQAHVSTYSGFAGGGALLGNAIAKFGNPDKYTVSLDEFSWDVAKSLYNNIVQSWNGGVGTGILTKGQVFASDNQAWTEKGLLDYFPGLLLQVTIEDYHKFFTAGTISSGLSALQLMFGAQVGFQQQDRPGVPDTRNQDYIIMREGSLDGRIIFIEERVGALDAIFPVGAFARSHPGQAFVNEIAEFFYKEDKVKAERGLRSALQMADSWLSGIHNGAAKVVAELGAMVLKSLEGGPTGFNLGITDELTSYLGANNKTSNPLRPCRSTLRSAECL